MIVVCVGHFLLLFRFIGTFICHADCLGGATARRGHHVSIHFAHLQHHKLDGYRRRRRPGGGPGRLCDARRADSPRTAGCFASRQGCEGGPVHSDQLAKLRTEV